MNELGIKVVRNNTLPKSRALNPIPFTIVVSRAKTAFTHPSLHRTLEKLRLKGKVGGVIYLEDKPNKTLILAGYQPLGEPLNENLSNLGIASNSERMTLEHLVRTYPGWHVTEFITGKGISPSREEHLKKMGLWPPRDITIEERLEKVRRYVEQERQPK